MSLEEKLGQMTAVEATGLQSHSDIRNYCLGAVLRPDKGGPAVTPAQFAKTGEELQSWAFRTRLKIPLLCGIDTLNGNSNVKGAVVFPSVMGLAATGDPALVEQAGRVIARETAATGIRWILADLSGTLEIAPAMFAGLHGNTVAEPTSILTCSKIRKGQPVPLKGEGFVVSDPATSDNQGEAIARQINAGVDMVLFPAANPGYVEFIRTLGSLVAEQKVSMTRIDDAVSRILRAKLELGLFEEPFPDRRLLETVGSPAHWEVARECVRHSLVLVKNENNVLPLSKTLKQLHVIGDTALAQALRTRLPDVEIREDAGDSVTGTSAVIVLAREGKDFDRRGKSVPTITLLSSETPIPLQGLLGKTDALIIAWKPGTEAPAIIDALLGEHPFSGKLPRPWPGLPTTGGTNETTGN